MRCCLALGGAFQEDLYLVTLQGVCNLRNKELG